MQIARHFTNLLSKDIQKTSRFFCELIGLEVEYESDWFIHLKSKENPALELGILPLDSEIIPESHQQGCSGTLLTFTTKDVDSMYEALDKGSCVVVEAPRDLFYGQRRLLLLEEASGALIDISSECAPSKEFMNRFNS